ncbi:hypothetical protein AZE42_13423 [Rhizopogon vesiculosus]|uniref:Uncharacterized protein n=1 Tax=Rhizopogon vesiculosus TaxID=180088 RepID=A0A1J8QBV8_9AGAM|nr:hypothetical protein AZE42_13423 [Rhizopogon vesiculosus]
MDARILLPRMPAGLAHAEGVLPG